MERMLEDFVKVVGIFKDVFIGVEKGGSLQELLEEWDSWDNKVQYFLVVVG